MKICPKCSKQHSNYGVFCSRQCANSRGKRTEEFKRLVSSKLKGRQPSVLELENAKLGRETRSYKQTQSHKEKIRQANIDRSEQKIATLAWDRLSRTLKIRKFTRDKNSRCEHCGWDKTHPKTNQRLLQIHHVNGDNLDWAYDNLQLLCPNCHSMTENYMFYGKAHTVVA